MNINNFFKENPKLALCFSGGTDSSYLLYLGKFNNADIQPYYIKSVFQPEFEFRDAEKLCSELGIKLNVINFDILSVANVAQNSKERCYYCKKNLFGQIKSHALAKGYSLLIDGSNASDNSEERPGMKAAKELRVRSPLRESGLSKSDVRKLSREAGLFTWDKPSYSCLATRIKSGVTITLKDLKDVEQSENYLFSLGFKDFRARMVDGGIKLQITENDIPLLLKNRNIILNEFANFSEVLLDLGTVK